jgi:MATE family multidrug resistance protein
MVVNMGVYSAIAALMSRFGAVTLAAHHIAFNLLAVTFALPLGAAAAGAVRVGQRIGANDPDGAASAVRVAYGSTLAAAAAVGACFLAIPSALVGVYTSDRDVIAAGAALVGIGAVLNVFDSFQLVATRALQGLVDTKVPMLLAIACHWCVSIPLGYALAFPAGWGPAGLWWGLTAGMAALAALLSARLVHGLRRVRPAPARRSTKV